MKQIIPFSKELLLNTKINEITSISLEHTLGLKKANLVSGEFHISGDYKMTSASLNREKFYFTLPFEINLSCEYEESSINIDIDNFYYEIINDDSIKVNIDVFVDGVKKKEKVALGENENFATEEDTSSVREEDVKENNPIIENAIDEIRKNTQNESTKKNTSDTEEIKVELISDDRKEVSKINNSLMDKDIVLKKEDLFFPSSDDLEKEKVNNELKKEVDLSPNMSVNYEKIPIINFDESSVKNVKREVLVNSDENNISNSNKVNDESNSNTTNVNNNVNNNINNNSSISQDDSDTNSQKNALDILQGDNFDTDTYVTYYVYTIKEDDSLEKIKTDFGVTDEELSNYNDMANFKPGLKLIIPSTKDE